MQDKYGDDVRGWVQEYYGEVLKASGDLATNACCAVAPPAYLRSLLENVPAEVQEQFYGCGFPIAEALGGATVVDLGCGTGRDVYLLSQLVGERGAVHGLDMTRSQLEVARRHRDWQAQRLGLDAPNVHFHEGYIEDLSALGLAAASVDVVVSNCVVNLSPRKDLVLQQVYDLLADGGEFYLSDVVADRRLPEDLARDPVLYSECLGGAMYRHDFEDAAKAAGFLDPRVIEVAPITVGNDEILAKIGPTRFFSVTYRLFKLPQLEPRCEDYGQVATYRGSVPHHEHVFTLDDHHLFERGRPERVCGNTASMLESTRLREYFRIEGSREVHYGRFDCSATMAAQQYQTGAETSSSTCC